MELVSGMQPGCSAANPKEGAAVFRSMRASGAHLAGVPKNAYRHFMTTLLDQGIQAIRELPAERQDMAGEILLTLAASAPRYELTPEQIEDLKLGLAQLDRGEFASDEEVAGMWKKFGL